MGYQERAIVMCALYDEREDDEVDGVGLCGRIEHGGELKELTRAQAIEPQRRSPGEAVQIGGEVAG